MLAAAEAEAGVLEPFWTVSWYGARILKVHSGDRASVRSVTALSEQIASCQISAAELAATSFMGAACSGGFGVAIRVVVRCVGMLSTTAEDRLV